MDPKTKRAIKHALNIAITPSVLFLNSVSLLLHVEKWFLQREIYFPREAGALSLA